MRGSALALDRTRQLRFDSSLSSTILTSVTSSPTSLTRASSSGSATMACTRMVVARPWPLHTAASSTTAPSTFLSPQSMLGARRAIEARPAVVRPLRAPRRRRRGCFANADRRMCGAKTHVLRGLGTGSVGAYRALAGCGDVSSFFLHAYTKWHRVRERLRRSALLTLVSRVARSRTKPQTTPITHRATWAETPSTFAGLVSPLRGV